MQSLLQEETLFFSGFNFRNGGAHLRRWHPQRAMDLEWTCSLPPWEPAYGVLNVSKTILAMIHTDNLDTQR